MTTIFNSFYCSFSKKIERHSIIIMRIYLSIVYICFVGLKIILISPAGDLGEETVFWFKPEIFIPVLGLCEVLIGLGLLIKRLVPLTILLLLLHMIATIFPLFLLTDACFDNFPYRPALVGQYIIKNLVLVAGALVIAGKHNSNYCSQQ